MTDPLVGAVRNTRIASTLCYVQSVFLLLSTMALGIPVFAEGQASLPVVLRLATMAGVGIAFFVAARLLRRRSLRGAQLAVVLVGCEIALRLFIGATLLNVWFAVDLGIVALIAASWRSFERAASGAGVPVA